MPGLEDRIVRALSAAGGTSSDFDLNPEVALAPGRRLRPAGVLVGIDVTGALPRLWLTKRSSRLQHHPGQIAFPGGKVDDGDTDATAAALREAAEEIALPAGHARVLGVLDPHETVTGFTVTPVVALVERPFDVRAEPGEVEEAFTVPLDHVLDRSRYRIESRFWRGSRRFYFTVPYGPYYIWGATARMLRGLAERMAT